MGNLQLLIAALAILAATATLPATVVEAAVADTVTPDFFDGIKNQAQDSCAGKSFYTRDALLQAANSYPDFGNTPREVAAFFAHVTHETGSMCYVEEINKSDYCDPAQYPCAPGKQYFGRGPLQLTWNYNYAMCGQALNFDGVGDPDSVARDPVLTWRAALWFWMTNVRPVLDQGFGATIRAINGIECNGGNAPAVQARVGFYNTYCQRFGIQPEANTGC
ncbi:unnamed protein product [Linum tenue]|uniref:chitinase n=1 Tax=Linum tenue TaxID=586396 RepID=A0AAV0P9M4_9ROSI|nr:unnamed protein product [Linum tenue]